jgi:signal peptidase I
MGNQGDAPLNELSPSEPITTSSRRRKTRILVAVIALCTPVALLGTFVLLVTFHVGFRAYTIPSEAMEPTLHGCFGCENDRVIVRTFAYSVERGDIVVFNAPPGSSPAIKQLVKRVIALPGETIETRDNRVFVTPADGGTPKSLSEPYVNPKCVDFGGATANLVKTKVPPGQYYVLGDNRCQSSDSRTYGPIKANSVVGVAILRGWPLSRLSRL